MVQNKMELNVKKVNSHKAGLALLDAIGVTESTVVSESCQLEIFKILFDWQPSTAPVGMTCRACDIRWSGVLYASHITGRGGGTARCDNRG